MSHPTFPNIQSIGLVRRNKAVKIIQNAWKDAYYNPQFQVCKTRLRREFCTLEQELVRILLR